MLQVDSLHYLAWLSAGKMCVCNVSSLDIWHLALYGRLVMASSYIIHTDNSITIFHADNFIEIFQVQFGFPQFPDAGIFYSATVQSHHGVRYLVQGKLNNPRVVARCENIFSVFAGRHRDLQHLQSVDIVSTKCPPHKFLTTVTHRSANFLLPCQVACLSFISFIFISTFHFQMVLSQSQCRHTRPGHLHGDADRLHPDGDHQHLHPPHLHPPLHVYRALPHLLLRDVVEVAHQVLWGSSSGHGEADWDSQ